MNLRTALQPRDTAGAARAMFSLHVTGATATLAGALATMGDTRSPVWFLGLTAGLVAVVAGAWLLRRVDDGTSPVWTVMPAASILLIIALWVAVPQRSLHTELFMWFPGMYLARQLPRRWAWAGIGLCASIIAALYFARYPVRAAALNTLYFDATFVVITVRLTLTGQRFDKQLSHAERRASVDPLTGLVTRAALEAAAQSALAVASSQQGAALALLDVDNFKAVNDTFGHPAGDTVLTEIAAILRRLCRSTDVVARLGGDELAILFADLPYHLVHTRVDSLRLAIGDHLFQLGRAAGQHVTVSVGAAHSQDGAATLPDLYLQADRALYAAKRRGRDCTEVFERSEDSVLPVAATA